MKQIIAIIQPHMLTKVEHALHALPHFPGMSLLRVKGYGRGTGADHAYRSVDWTSDEKDHIMILIMCSDRLVPQVLAAITQSGHTGLRGDGMIAVSGVEHLVRIRTGEVDEDAV